MDYMGETIWDLNPAYLSFLLGIVARTGFWLGLGDRRWINARDDGEVVVFSVGEISSLAGYFLP